MTCPLPIPRSLRERPAAGSWRTASGVRTPWAVEAVLLGLAGVLGDAGALVQSRTRGWSPRAVVADDDGGPAAAGDEGVELAREAPSADRGVDDEGQRPS